MIAVSKIVRDAAAGRRAGIECVYGLAVPVRNLGRASRFYQRVFGFRLIRDDHGLDRTSTLIDPCNEIHLVLEEGAPPIPRSTSVPARRQPYARLRQPWIFLVADLEGVRARVWELGVRIARDSGAPDHVFRRPGGGSLYVHDSEGNEIELIEVDAGLENTASPQFPAGSAAGNSTRSQRLP